MMKKVLTVFVAIMMIASVFPAFSLAGENVTIQVVVPSNVQDFPDGI